MAVTVHDHVMMQFVGLGSASVAMVSGWTFICTCFSVSLHQKFLQCRNEVYLHLRLLGNTHLQILKKKCIVDVNDFELTCLNEELQHLEFLIQFFFSWIKMRNLFLGQGHLIAHSHLPTYAERYPKCSYQNYQNTTTNGPSNSIKHQHFKPLKLNK